MVKGNYSNRPVKNPDNRHSGPVIDRFRVRPGMTGRYYCHSGMTRVAGIACIAILLISISASVLAQTAAELGAEQSEQILRQEQRRLKMLERERLLRELERSLFPVEVLPPRPKDRAVSTDTCFNITEIELRGADNLFQAEKESLRQPYLN